MINAQRLFSLTMPVKVVRTQKKLSASSTSEQYHLDFSAQEVINKFSKFKNYLNYNHVQIQILKFEIQEGKRNLHGETGYLDVQYMGKSMLLLSSKRRFSLLPLVYFQENVGAKSSTFKFYFNPFICEICSLNRFISFKVHHFTQIYRLTRALSI